MRIDLVILSSVFALVLFSCTTNDEEESAPVAQVGAAQLGPQADLNGDGVLSDDEVATFYHRDALAEYDLDGDGHISRSEWNQAHPSPAESDEHFNRFDKDDDGHVSESEAVSYVTEHVSFGDQFKKYDEDGDFALHWSEVDGKAPDELNVTLFSIHM